MFSQTAEYALRSMACLALSPSELVPVSTLATVTKVPSNYLAKVLQQLAGADLIVGKRGVGGGYKLARPAREIKLMQVVRATMTIDRIEVCPLGLPNHGPNLCPLHRKMDEAAAAVIRVLDDYTLEDIINDPKSNRPLCDATATARLTTSARSRAG